MTKSGTTTVDQVLLLVRILIGLGRTLSSTIDWKKLVTRNGKKFNVVVRFESASSDSHS